MSDVEGAGGFRRWAAVSGPAKDTDERTAFLRLVIGDDPQRDHFHRADHHGALDRDRFGRDEHGVRVVVRRRLGLLWGNGRCRGGLVLIAVMVVMFAGAVVMAVSVGVCGGKRMDVRPDGVAGRGVIAVGVAGRGYLTQQQAR